MPQSTIHTATRQSPNRSSWERYVYLVYLGSLFIAPFVDDLPAWQSWAIVAFLLACFLPLYFWSYHQRGSKALWGIAGMVTLGLLFTPLNSGAASFLIYASAAAGATSSPKTAYRIIAVILGLSLLAMLVSPIPWPYRLFAYLPALIFVPVVGFLTILAVERERTNRRLQEAQQENQRLAAIAERERIARDLHDLLGHTLSVITLKAELAAKLVERDPSKAANEMREVERISREATQQVREAVQGYKSRGLQGELVSAKLALEAANIQFDYLAETVQLSPAQESVLALALREAITNVIRHSAANRCAVQLLALKDGVRLEIHDNGKGTAIREGSGLSGMRQRIEALGGTLEIEGNNGTRLSLTLLQNTAAVSQDDRLVVPTSLRGT